MAAVEESQQLTELAIPILHELLQYTDVRLQAALRRTCVLFNHLLLPRVASCQEIRIFIPPGYDENLFNKTLKGFHAKCLEWFGHSPLRTVIVEGPYDHVSQLTDFCMGLDKIENLRLQQLIFMGQTFRDPFYLDCHIVLFGQNYLTKKNVCQQLTFHDVIFSKLHNVNEPEEIIGHGMEWDERKAYMAREQIIPIRGSLKARSARFHHDLLDLIERHCPELDEEQMADIMQWKATCKDRKHSDGLYNESQDMVTAARAADIRQMTKLGRTAFFYSMNHARREDQRSRQALVKLPENKL